MSRRDELNDETKPIPIWGWIQDRLYDTVFHIGDTTREFLWDVMQGPDQERNAAYVERQHSRNVRMGEKPLKLEDRKIFVTILERQNGERLTDYWRRKKAMIASPDKLELIDQFRTVMTEQQDASTNLSEKEKKLQQQKVEEQFREVQRAGQKSSARKSAKSPGQIY